MAKKVVTFGEIMLRLAPEGYYRFLQAESYGAPYGGGEANEGMIKLARKLLNNAPVDVLSALLDKFLGAEEESSAGIFRKLYGAYNGPSSF